MLLVDNCFSNVCIVQFFNPNEQSHADSFYSASSGHQQQAGPDWGHISQQSAHLYDQVEQEEEQGQEQEYGGEYSSGGPTDSGWSLCYTADGTPYFYSYELQVRNLFWW